MSSLKLTLGILAAGLMLSGCMQATTYEATNTANFKPHDKELLAKIRYVNTPVPEPFRRAIVETPGHEVGVPRAAVHERRGVVDRLRLARETNGLWEVAEDHVNPGVVDAWQCLSAIELHGAREMPHRTRHVPVAPGRDEPERGLHFRHIWIDLHRPVHC